MEDDEWRRAFDEPFDVTRARDIMIEFVARSPTARSVRGLIPMPNRARRFTPAGFSLPKRSGPSAGGD